MDEKRRRELEIRLAGAELSLAGIENAMTTVIQAKILRDGLSHDDPAIINAERAWGHLRAMQEATVVDIYDLNKQLNPVKK